VQPHEIVVVQGEVFQRRRAAQRPRQQGRDASSQRLVVAIARQVDQRAVEAVEALAPEQHQHLPVFVQCEDAARVAREIRRRRLQQLIARQRLEDVREAATVVARRRQREARDDARDLQAQQGHRRRALPPRRGGPQTQDPPLAAHAAATVEAFDADVVQVTGPVDAGAHRALRDHQQLGGAGLAQQILRAHARIRRRLQARRGARQGRIEQAELAAGLGREAGSPAGATQRGVAAAEEGEVAGEHPAQELAALGHHGGGQRRSMRLDLAQRRQHAGAHRLLVARRRLHVAQRPVEVHGELRRLRPVHGSGEFELLPRLRARLRGGSGERQQASTAIASRGQDRVGQAAHDVARGLERHQHRVDQERHVVADDEYPAGIAGLHFDVDLAAPVACAQGEVRRDVGAERGGQLVAQHRGQGSGGARGGHGDSSARPGAAGPRSPRRAAARPRRPSRSGGRR
jgi:hypothetical protein